MYICNIRDFPKYNCARNTMYMYMYVGRKVNNSPRVNLHGNLPLHIHVLPPFPPCLITLLETLIQWKKQYCVSGQLQNSMTSMSSYK